MPEVYFIMPKKKSKKVLRKKSVSKKITPVKNNLVVEEIKSGKKFAKSVEEILEESDEPISGVRVKRSSPSLRQINFSSEPPEFEEPDERREEKKPERGLYSGKQSDYVENSAEKKEKYEARSSRVDSLNPVSESSKTSLRKAEPISSEINQWNEKNAEEKEYSPKSERLSQQENTGRSFQNPKRDYEIK